MVVAMPCLFTIRAGIMRGASYTSRVGLYGHILRYLALLIPVAAFVLSNAR